MRRSLRASLIRCRSSGCPRAAVIMAHTSPADVLWEMENGLCTQLAVTCTLFSQLQQSSWCIFQFANRIRKIKHSAWEWRQFTTPRAVEPPWHHSHFYCISIIRYLKKLKKATLMVKTFLHNSTAQQNRWFRTIFPCSVKHAPRTSNLIWWPFQRMPLIRLMLLHCNSTANLFEVLLMKEQLLPIKAHLVTSVTLS